MTPVLLRKPIEGQLETKTGESAKIESCTRNSTTTHQIVAKRLRGKGSKVSLWMLSLEDDNVYLAFCFELKKQKYFAAVNAETSEIQVEPLNDPLSEVDRKFLFKWVYPQRQHTWNNLCSVAEPSKYLTVSTSNTFTLSSSQETLFKFKIKKKQRVQKLLDSHSTL